jgi:hypothetical protein
MALLDPLLVIGANAMRTAITHIALSTADPGTSSPGTNQSSAARQAANWATVTAGGDFSLTSALNFTGGALGGPVHSACFWTAVTSGTFYGSQPLTGDLFFNGAGEYTITALTVNGSST